MHGVAPRMCGQVVHALLGGGAGGRSPGSIYADTAVEKVRMLRCSNSSSEYVRMLAALDYLPWSPSRAARSVRLWTLRMMSRTLRPRARGANNIFNHNTNV